MRVVSLRFIATVALVLAPYSVDARGLLEKSQQTFAGACLDGDLPSSRLVEICENALTAQGASETQRIEIKVNLADALYSLDELNRAQTVIDDVLSEDPANGAALTLAGWIDWDLDDFEAAAVHFEASVSIGPTSQNLAGVASSRHRAEQISQSEFMILMDAALAIRPDYIWALREKGWALVDFNDLAGAEMTFRDAVVLDEHNPWSLYGLGYVLNKLDRYEEALEYLNRAAQEDGAPISVYSQRSLARFYRGRYKLAVADADRIIKAWPNSATGYVRRARALAAMGQRQIAIHELQTRVEKAPDSWTVYWLADLLLDDERFEDGLAALDWTYTHGAPDYYDHKLRALLLVELGRNEEAKRAINAALEVKDTAAYPHFYLALVLADEADFDASGASMLHALKQGLPERHIKQFLQALVAKGAFVEAVRWRVTFGDWQASERE